MILTESLKKGRWSVTMFESVFCMGCSTMEEHSSNLCLNVLSDFGITTGSMAT